MVEKRKRKADYMRKFRQAERKFLREARIKLPSDWKKIAKEFGIEAGKRGPKKRRRPTKRRKR